MTNSVFIRRAAAIAALVAFAVLLVCVVKDCTAGFDDPVRAWFYSLRGPAITGVAIVITTLANKLMNSLIKHLVERPRPEVVHLVTEHGFSFPSGHSITSMFFYGFAIWLVWRYVDNQTARRILTVLLAIPMLLVGPTRIYLGVHFPTDVLGAWCLGFAAIVLFIEIVCVYDKKTALKSGEVK